MVVINIFLSAIVLMAMIRCDTLVSRNYTESTSSKVSGENETTTESEYPFLVAIGLKDKFSRSVNYTTTVCSGSIIDNYRVVTTCSCFEHARRDGEHGRTRPMDLAVSAGIRPDLGEADIWNVDDIEYHPHCYKNSNYKTFTGNAAIVWVVKPGFTFNLWIQPMNIYPRLSREEAPKELYMMSSSAMKCTAVGWGSKSPKMQKLSAYLIPSEECVNPSCDRELNCRHSNYETGFMVRMNGVRVKSAGLTTGAPLICNGVLWALIDTAKSCTNNIFTVSSPGELLYAFHNFTDDTSMNKTMFSLVARNCANSYKWSLLILLAAFVPFQIMV